MKAYNYTPSNLGAHAYFEKEAGSNMLMMLLMLLLGGAGGSWLSKLMGKSKADGVANQKPKIDPNATASVAARHLADQTALPEGISSKLDEIHDIAQNGSMDDLYDMIGKYDLENVVQTAFKADATKGVALYQAFQSDPRLKGLVTNPDPTGKVEAEYEPGALMGPGGKINRGLTNAGKSLDKSVKGMFLSDADKAQYNQLHDNKGRLPSNISAEALAKYQIANGLPVSKGKYFEAAGKVPYNRFRNSTFATEGEDTSPKYNKYVADLQEKGRILKDKVDFNWGVNTPVPKAPTTAIPQLGTKESPYVVAAKNRMNPINRTLSKAMAPGSQARALQAIKGKATQFMGNQTKATSIPSTLGTKAKKFTPPVKKDLTVYGGSTAVG